MQITCLLPLGYLMCRSVCAKNMLMPRICSAACPWPGAANLNAADLLTLARIASRGQWCIIYTSRRMLSCAVLVQLVKDQFQGCACLRFWARC